MRGREVREVEGWTEGVLYASDPSPNSRSRQRPRGSEVTEVFIGAPKRGGASPFVITRRRVG